MLVIRVELWRDPRAKEKETLGVVKIANDQTGTEEVGNYEITVQTTGKATRTFRLEGHRRAGGFWLLALQVLQQFLRPTVQFSGSKPSVPPGR